MLARDLKSVVKTISPALAGATLPIFNCVNFDDERIWSTNLEATIEVGCDVAGVMASIPQKPLKALSHRSTRRTMSSCDPPMVR